MGIHASDNLSHLAHQEAEPNAPGFYDYDEYTIIELVRDGKHERRLQVATFAGMCDMWEKARQEFLRLFNAKRPVKLYGRVFN